MLRRAPTVCKGLRGVRGFTLTELLVSIAIIGVSAMLVAPSFSEQIATYRVRTGAESVMNGLNQARAEAVRRNTPVRFELSGDGSGWRVIQVDTSAVLRSRAAAESPGLDAASSNANLGVTFRPTGIVDASDTPLTQISITSAASSSDSRLINVLGGGLIRMCDPAATAANDPRRC